MTLSLNANFTRAFRDNVVEPRWMVRIYIASSTSVILVNGPMDSSAAQHWPIVVEGISQLKREVDVFTRKIRVDTIDVQLTNDPFVRDLIQTYPIAGSRIQILIGTPALAAGDFEDYFVGIVDDIIPSPDGVTITTKSCASKLREATYMGAFVSKHPLECITDLLDAADIHSDLIDATSLAYDVDTTRSHWVVDRSDNDLHLDRAITSPTEISRLIDELAQMVQGTLFVDESGKFTFQYLDLTRASAADWTDDDVFDVNVRSLYSMRRNQIIATSHAAPGQSDKNPWEDTVSYTRDDTNAQTRFSYFNVSGSNPKAHTGKLEMAWVSGSCTKSGGAFGNPSVGATINLVLSSGTGYAICGTRWPGFPSGSQPANSQVSATRLLYMLIEDEVVSFDTLTVDATQYMNIYTRGDGNSFETYLAPWLITSAVPVFATARVAARDVFGTASTLNHNTLRPGHSVHHMYDVTIATDVANTQLRRFANGAPVVELRTSMREYAVQVGDFVTLTLGAEQICWYGHDGVDTNVKWEVTSKTVDLDSDSPSILWTLVYATETAPPSAVLSHLGLRADPRVYSFRAGSSMDNDDVFRKAVVSGFNLSFSGVSLTVTLGAGVASAGESRSELYDGFDLTLTASKDNYIYWDCSRGSIVLREVALAAAQPTNIGSQEILLWKATTDGSGVTTGFDNREYWFLQPYTVSGTTWCANPDSPLANTGLQFPRKGA